MKDTINSYKQLKHLTGTYEYDNTTNAATINVWGCPRGVMVKEIDCGIVSSKFELQSNYYIHFRTNTLGKGMNPLILPAMG